MKRPTNTAGPHRAQPCGTIHADELLPIRELHTRLGWGARTVALAQKQGLRVLRFGKRKYLKGSDIIAFLESVQPDGERAQGKGAAMNTYFHTILPSYGEADSQRPRFWPPASIQKPPTVTTSAGRPSCGACGPCC